MTGLVVLGLGGVLAVGALVAFVVARPAQRDESAESTLSGAPPVRTEQQDANATAGAVREGLALLREGLSFARERVNAGDDAAATRTKLDAHEASSGTER